MALPNGAEDRSAEARQVGQEAGCGPRREVRGKAVGARGGKDAGFCSGLSPALPPAGGETEHTYITAPVTCLGPRIKAGTGSPGAGVRSQEFSDLPKVEQEDTDEGVSRQLM